MSRQQDEQRLCLLEGNTSPPRHRSVSSLSLSLPPRSISPGRTGVDSQEREARSSSFRSSFPVKISPE